MLEHLFGSKTRVKLLQIFFRSPERAFFVRELSRLAETQLNAVRREIANLVSLGIVAPTAPSRVSDQPGTERSKFFRLDGASLMHYELKALLQKARLLEEQALVQAVKTRAGKIRLFMLTGFFTGESTVATDLLIVGAVKPLVLAKIIRDFEKESGAAIRYTVMDEKEFKDRREIGDKFLYSILEAKHLTAIDDLAVS